MSSEAAGARGSKQVSFAQVSVPRLLFALLRQRFTGTAVVQQAAPNDGPRTIWFRGGMPVFTDWVAPSEVLGQVLVTQRVIDDSQLLQALEAMADQGGLLGQHLVKLGLLDRPALLDGLRQQCVRKLTQLFTLRDGVADVEVGTAAGPDPDLLPVNVLGLILAGVGATHGEARIEAELGRALHGRLRASRAMERYRAHFRFRPDDEAIVNGLLQGTQLAQLSALPGVSPRRAAQVIYVLWACQMLHSGVAAEPSGPVPAVPASAVRSSPAQPPPATAEPPRPTPSSTGTARAAPASPPPVTPSSTPSSTAVASSPPAASASPPPPPPASPTPSAAARVPSTTSASAAPSSSPGDPDDFLAELVALEEKIESGIHAFDLFGLELSASKRDVRGAWADLSKRFHPDALKAQGRGELSDRVGSVFAALSEAQQILANPDERTKLREAIERGDHESGSSGSDATAQAHAVFQAELLAKEGDKLLRGNKFERALERYREAAKYNADEPDVHAATLWCEYQVSPKGAPDLQRAQLGLRNVAEASPRTARAHYFLGFILATQNSLQLARASFMQAAALDRRLIDAERQARAIKARMSSGPSDATKGKGQGRLDKVKAFLLSGGNKK